MGSCHRGRTLPLSLADRGLLQTDQTNSAAHRFSGQLRQCRALAGLDGLIGLCAFALPSLGQSMAGKLRAPVDVPALGLVGEARRHFFAQKLWDSTSTLATTGRTTASLFARLEARGLSNLWDSTTAQTPFGNQTSKILNLTFASIQKSVRCAQQIAYSLPLSLRYGMTVT